MKVSSSPIVMKSKQIKTSLLKNVKPISILIPTDQIDYGSIKTGIMPNLIHSLDSSNIHILIRNLKNNFNKRFIDLYTIHDCFATHYKNMYLIE
jgi:DNA-directed RNA polymerase